MRKIYVLRPILKGAILKKKLPKSMLLNVKIFLKSMILNEKDFE